MHKKYTQRANKEVERNISRATERAIQNVLDEEKNRPVKELYYKIADTAKYLGLAEVHYFGFVDNYWHEGLKFIGVKGHDVKKILYLLHAEGCTPDDTRPNKDEKKFNYRFKYNDLYVFIGIELHTSCKKVQVGVTEAPVYEIQCGDDEDVVEMDFEPVKDDDISE